MNAAAMLLPLPLPLLTLTIGLAAAQTGPGSPPGLTPDVAWRPARPLQGSLVVIGVRVPAGDRVAEVAGELAGEPLHFQDSDGWFRAVGGVPITAHDSIRMLLIIEREGATDSLARWLPVSVLRAGHETLDAPPEFVQPPASATARIRAERELVRRLKRHVRDTPRLWHEQFERPTPGAITDRFGVTRVFNGMVESRHLGVDFAGSRGAPVRATNRGVVAFVGDLYYSGTTVFLDHGGGILTAYLHLSRTLVALGDTVARGRVIGRVGTSGRATGPHLHWFASYGDVTVNPLDLLTLDLGEPFGVPAYSR